MTMLPYYRHGGYITPETSTVGTRFYKVVAHLMLFRKANDTPFLLLRFGKQVDSHNNGGKTR